MSYKGTVLFTCDWCGKEEPGVAQAESDYNFEVLRPGKWLVESDEDFCSEICAVRHLAKKYSDWVKKLEDEEKKKTGGTVRPITEEDLQAIAVARVPGPGRVTGIGDA